jgi:hypothetical protein
LVDDDHFQVELGRVVLQKRSQSIKEGSPLREKVRVEIAPNLEVRMEPEKEERKRESITKVSNILHTNPDKESITINRTFFSIISSSTN